MSESNVTQKQIAKLAGVTQSTVSKILRGQEITGLSQEKRQAVIDAAIKLGYKPKASSKMPALDKK